MERQYCVSEAGCINITYTQTSTDFALLNLRSDDFFIYFICIQITQDLPPQINYSLSLSLSL